MPDGASAREQVAAPQPREELAPWQHIDAVVDPRATLVADEDGAARAVLADKGAEPTKPGRVHAARALDLDGHLASAQDEIHFETAFRPPEMHVVIQMPV